jgi:hypothetical protein
VDLNQWPEATLTSSAEEVPITYKAGGDGSLHAGGLRLGGVSRCPGLDVFSWQHKSPGDRRFVSFSLSVVSLVRFCS